MTAIHVHAEFASAESDRHRTAAEITAAACNSNAGSQSWLFRRVEIVTAL